MLIGGAFGEAGAEIVVEEFMEGVEASFSRSSTAKTPLLRITSASETATRAEYRRDGSLFTGAGGHGRNCRHRHGKDRPTHCGGDEGGTANLIRVFSMRV